MAYNSIKKEVQTFGPIEASFKVYDDFLHYKNGELTKDVILKYILFLIKIQRSKFYLHTN